MNLLFFDVHTNQQQCCEHLTLSGQVHVILLFLFSLFSFSEIHTQGALH
jgi:hypothetical protein